MRLAWLHIETSNKQEKICGRTVKLQGKNKKCKKLKDFAIASVCRERGWRRTSRLVRRWWRFWWRNIQTGRFLNEKLATLLSASISVHMYFHYVLNLFEFVSSRGLLMRRYGTGWIFFVRATECGAKAHELTQLKNRKTRGCTKVVCQHCS